MHRKMAVLHTSFVFINIEPVFRDLFQEMIPDVEVIDFVDSQVLADVRKVGKVEVSHIRRMCHLAQAAEDAGVDLIFSACSSLGPSMDVARKLVKVPIVKIDDPMTQKAVALGSKIGVMATVPTTLPPTVDLIQQWANEENKPVEIVQKLCDGAFEILMAGDRERHDQMVHAGAAELAPQVDLIVLAQASMSRLAPELSDQVGKTVLSSPRLAAQYVKSFFDNLPA
jgi:Asp/Glu/hydantoin racemase